MFLKIHFVKIQSIFHDSHEIFFFKLSFWLRFKIEYKSIYLALKIIQLWNFNFFFFFLKTQFSYVLCFYKTFLGEWVFFFVFFCIFIVFRQQGTSFKTILLFYETWRKFKHENYPVKKTKKNKQKKKHVDFCIWKFLKTLKQILRFKIVFEKVGYFFKISFSDNNQRDIWRKKMMQVSLSQLQLIKCILWVFLQNFLGNNFDLPFRCPRQMKSVYLHVFRPIFPLF